MNRFLQGFGLLLMLLFLPCRVWSEMAAPPSDDQLQRLVAGEILLKAVQTDEAGGAGEARILTFGDAQSFWDVIISCDLAFVFVDGLRECEVLEDSGDRALVRQVVKKHWLIPRQEFVFESLRTPYEAIEFRLVEGDLDVLHGHWRFTRLQEGLIVDYQARIKPAIPAPRFLVRRTILKDTPDLLACIRGLSGGSGSKAASRADLARCPGDAATAQ